jgi:hypothetical protein
VGKTMRKNKQSVRSLTAFIVTWSFLILTVTGLILYIIPHGRVAYWIHWSFAGMEKEQWGGVHMMFGGVFIVSGILHLYFNWKPFKKYFADRVQGHLKLKQEIITATLFTGVIFFLSVFNLPPASWIFDLNEKIKDSWVSSPELEPPFGHAEEVSLAAISQKMSIDLNAAMLELKKNGISFESKQESLESIARKNDITPMAVYSFIRKFEKRSYVNINQMTAQQLQVEFSGTGLGRKTLAETMRLIDVDLTTGLNRLKQKGITADENDRLKSIADTHNLTPIELLLIIANKH